VALAGHPPRSDSFAAAARAAAASLGRLDDEAYGRALAEASVLRALMQAG
jgi:hypothetical protein